MEHKHHTEGSPTLRDKIVGQIKAEHIAMRPRLYFTLQVAAIALISFLVLVISVFIFNFILFSIRINGHEAFLSFGPRGFAAFIMFFPWMFLVIDLILIAVLEWLLRTFKFGYRLPIIYVLGGILALTLVTGFALDRGTGFNDRMMERAGGPGIRGPLGGMYRDVRRPPHDGMCRCTITAIDGNTLTVSTLAPEASTTLLVILPENDPRATTTGLAVGDIVFIAGDRDEDTIRAFGVRKIDPNKKTPFLIKGKMGRPELK